MRHEDAISTIALAKGLESDPVLGILASDLAGLGFSVEASERFGDFVRGYGKVQ